MILSLVKSGNMSFEMFLRWKWSQGQNHGHNMYQSKSAVVHNYFCWPGLICGHAFFREPRHSDASSSGSWDCPPHGFRSRWGWTQVSFFFSFCHFIPLSILAILVGLEYLIVTLSFYECQVRPFPPSHDLDCSISFWHYLPFTGQHTAYTKTGQVFHVKKGKI